MATKNITGLHDRSIVVSTSGNTYNIAQNATVLTTVGLTPPSAAIMEDPTAMPSPANNTFNIEGRVIGGDIGINLTGSNDKVHVGATGRVSGGYGIAVTGADTAVTNDGEIIALQGSGIDATGGDRMEFRNNGEIFGADGIVLIGVDQGLVVNGSDGDIVALQMGVHIASGIGESAKFINHGSVFSSTFAAGFFGGLGSETVINDGTIRGGITLSDGNDRIDNRGGTIKGEIWGGYDDDVLITDKASDKLSEISGEGNDTVKSTVSYKLADSVENLFLIGNANINGTGTSYDDKLHGNSGNNIVKGLGGADELWGGKGDDLLAGGADADVFHFSKGNDRDTISDFVQGTDHIDVSGWPEMGDLNDVKSHAHNDGSDVVIELGTDSLTIKGIHKADLTGADFLFPI